MEKRVFDFAVDLRAMEESHDQMEISGHASVFNQKTRLYGQVFEQIIPGAFAQNLQDDCYALFNHDPSLVLASIASKTLSLSEDSTGLLAKIKIPNTTLGRDLYQLVKSGIIRKMSFAFQADKDSIFYQNNDDGSTLVTITKIKRLYDVSPVTYPAYDGTDISADLRSAIQDHFKPDPAIQILKNQTDLEKIRLDLKRYIDLKNR